MNSKLTDKNKATRESVALSKYKKQYYRGFHNGFHGIRSFKFLGEYVGIEGENEIYKVSIQTATKLNKRVCQLSDCTCGEMIASIRIDRFGERNCTVSLPRDKDKNIIGNYPNF